MTKASEKGRAVAAAEQAPLSSPASAPTSAPLTVLGIETSCDETAVAVLRLHPAPPGEDGPGRAEVLADIVYSQVKEHAAFGGVVPEIAARAHVALLDRLLRAALDEAGLRWRDIDAVAATAGPGLIGGLLVGLMSAKAIALAHRVPLLAVNHLQAHALSPMLAGAGVRPPYLLLLVSGGHTQLISVDDIDRYRRLGTTIDDALGEAFDKVAKMLDLGYPGGPAVERLAAQGDAARFDFPRPMLRREECHFSFSGLKTAVRTAILDLAGSGAATQNGGSSLREQDRADICASFQQAVVDTLADRVRCAMGRFRGLHPQARQPWLVLAGGVAANAAIRAALEEVARAEGFRLAAPPVRLCTDNAVMVAHVGALKLARGEVDGLDVSARPRWPLDEAAEPAPFAGVKG